MFISMNKLPVIHENGTLYRVKNKGRESANTLTVDHAGSPKVTVSSMTPRPILTGIIVFLVAKILYNSKRPPVQLDWNGKT